MVSRTFHTKMFKDEYLSKKNFILKIFLEAMPLALLLSKSLQHCQEQKIVIASKFNKFYTLYTKTKISSLKNLFYPILFLLGKNSVRYVVPRICVKASRVTIDPWCFTIEFMVVWFEKKIYSQDHVLTVLSIFLFENYNFFSSPFTPNSQT